MLGCLLKSLYSCCSELKLFCELWELLDLIFPNNPCLIKYSFTLCIHRLLFRSVLWGPIYMFWEFSLPNLLPLPNLFSKTLSCYFQMPQSLWTLIIFSTPECAIECLISPSLCYNPASASKKVRASVVFTSVVFFFLRNHIPELPVF